jgi:hypothetical protein
LSVDWYLYLAEEPDLPQELDDAAYVGVIEGLPDCSAFVELLSCVVEVDAMDQNVFNS